MNMHGKISWSGLLTSVVPTSVFLIATLAASLWSLNAGFRANLIVAGFSLLTGTASALWLGVSLASVVTHFQLQDGELTYARLGRRSQTVPVTHVVATSMPTSQWRRSRFWDGATIWLRDGRTLFLSFGHLDHAHVLVDHLRESAMSTDDSMDGGLVRSAVARTLIGQALTTCLLAAIGFVAILILGVAFHPDPGGASRQLFFTLGFVLLALCFTGFYFSVLRYWIGCVRWYRFDGCVLHYRTVLSASVGQRLVDELDLVVSRRPTSHQAEAGSWRLLRFRDGEQLKLQIGILQGATALYERLKTVMVRNRIARGLRPAAIVDSTHPLWSAVRSHLEDGEQVWWIGRPVYRWLWSEMSAEVVFGLIPGGIGLVALVAGTAIIVGGDFSAFPLVVVGGLFTSLGAWCMAAPWRYLRALRKTVYAVTSRRVMIVDGFTWGPQIAVVRTSERVLTFPRDRAIDYDVIGRGRDIVFGGEWRKGRRGSHYWGHHGFLAVDDVRAAETALECLLASDTAQA
jgi:hypothetical protein